MNPEKLAELAERWEAEARACREIECPPEYHAYWQGFAEALDQSAETLRSLASRGGE